MVKIVMVDLMVSPEWLIVRVSQMANSIGDQFLKAGLVNKTQLSKAEKSKGKQQKQKNKQKIEVVDEAAVAAQQTVAEKVARDRELNRQQKMDADSKAIHAQIRQLVELNRLPCGVGEVGYNFQDGTAIKKIYVTEDVHAKLGRAMLTIVRYDEGYAVIPSVVADKIRLRDASCIVSIAADQSESVEDDPYADYKVPDDLMW